LLSLFLFFNVEHSVLAEYQTISLWPFLTIFAANFSVDLAIA
jgi:hypothetical protein